MILRKKIDGPVRPTDQERARLLKYTQKIQGSILYNLISIVHYKTARRGAAELRACA